MCFWKKASSWKEIINSKPNIDRKADRIARKVMRKVEAAWRRGENRTVVYVSPNMHIKAKVKKLLSDQYGIPKQLISNWPNDAIQVSLIEYQRPEPPKYKMRKF